MKEIFEPDSIAIIGAAREEGKLGNIVLRNIISSGFKGKIYPINPKADEILGLRCYKSVKDIEDDIELAIFLVKGPLVPPLLEEAAEKGVKAAIIISAGFKEIGKEGAELERQVVEIVKEHGIRVLGPNCLGSINTFHDMNATFTSNYPEKGPLAIISQSGAICTTILDWNQETKVGFSRFVSVGNKADIDEADLIEYIGHDDETKVIGMYIEGAERGKAFVEMAKEATKRKAIVTLKAGRSSSGARAASSHTGSISGSDAIWDAAMEQAGVLRAKDMDELFDYCLAFSKLPMPEGEGLVIVTNAGGLGVMSADACNDHGVFMAELNENTVNKLRQGLPREATPYNPVDIVGDSDTERVRFAVETILQDENCKCLAAVFGPNDIIDLVAIAEVLADCRKKWDTPIVASFIGGKQVAPGAARVMELGIPNYDIPDRAMRAIAALMKCWKRRTDGTNEGAIVVKGDRNKVKDVLAAVRANNRLTLREDEGKVILNAYGISMPREGLATNAEQALKLADNIGYPVVMKVASPDILHKSDVGGVAIGLETPEEVKDSFHSILERSRARVPDARIDGVSVQQMISGREVIVGMNRDHQFGPVITFGLGGIFVEILKDVRNKIAPLSRADVDDMISSIKGYPILMGARGRGIADIESLKDMIFRLAQIAIDFPEIAELEVNPVIVGDKGEGCCAVDALVTLEK
ncbi:MAG: CoA-binding protein [Methanomassiliicoccales archaeon]|nr:CoA-binding protein [Methanomassiliicoccales archaeon]NYT15608.1 CoA-binding protein [Methanomassiliicoccales archaeon]